MSVLEQQLVREVESVPEFLKQEVLDFVMFLKERHLKQGIQKTPGVCGGEACVGETRLVVWMLVEARRAGYTDTEIAGLPRAECCPPRECMGLRRKSRRGD